MKKLILFLIVVLFLFASCASSRPCGGKVYRKAYGSYNSNASKR